MCIRDSFYRVNLLVFTPHEGFEGPTDARFLLEGAEGLAAVSYTHLRAHETVLDLVCRLLLEKKQHYQQIHTRHNNKINHSQKQ